MSGKQPYGDGPIKNVIPGMPEPEQIRQRVSKSFGGQKCPLFFTNARLKMEILKMTDDQYHAIKDRCSSSAIKDLRKSAAHLKASIDEPKESSSLSLGSVFHKLVLEPEAFDAAYVVTESTDKRTKLYKDAATQAETGGKMLISKEDYDTASLMRDRVLSHSRAGALLGKPGGHKEIVIFFDWNGVPCKCKLDHLLESFALINDLKSTRDASPESFQKDFIKYGYHIQGAFYLKGGESLGIPVNRFLITAQENCKPFLTAVYELSPDSLRLGRQEVERLLPIWQQCQETQQYPGYPETVTVLDLPAWEMKKLDDKPATAGGIIQF